MTNPRRRAMDRSGILARFALLFLLAGPLVLAASRALAGLPDTVFLEELTWTELRQLTDSGKKTIIIPIGGTEQNGPHMTLGKHNSRVRVLSEAIARALGDALVAPVVAYVPEGGLDPPTGHMRFPGTITVPRETFGRVLEYAARSLRAGGFRDIVLLGDHGGYQADAKAVAARLNKEWSGTAVRVHAIERYYQAVQTTFVKALKDRGYSEEEIGTHAGLADTSLMLAVDPRAVRTDRLRSPIDAARSEGVSGDPRRSSADLGRLGVDAIVTQTVDAIRTALAHR